MSVTITTRQWDDNLVYQYNIYGKDAQMVGGGYTYTIYGSEKEAAEHISRSIDLSELATQDTPTERYTVSIVEFGDNYSQLIEEFVEHLPGSADVAIASAARAVKEMGYTVMPDYDGGCCEVDGDDIAITVYPKETDIQ